jgi:transketolase
MKAPDNKGDSQRFSQAVADCFSRQKDAGTARAMALPEDLGLLQPIIFGDEQDAALVADLAAWREASAFAYPSQFRVTQEGTRRWLENGILKNPNRLLLLVIDASGERIGHVGLAWSVDHPLALEAESILRGRRDKAPGIMRAAMQAMLAWAVAELNPAHMFLRVFDDNDKAVRFYRQLGFTAASRLPLRRHEQDDDAVIYRPCGDDDHNAPDKYFLYMVHTLSEKQKMVRRPPRDLARAIRRRTLMMVHRACASHIGGGLSAADLLAHLYGGFLRIDPRSPDAADRDRLIVSKGHIAAAVYATLAECGYFPTKTLETFTENGSILAGHVSHHAPGVEFSTGSLGHGLSLGAGIALAGKSGGGKFGAYILLSDGECDEGSIWEAALFASAQKLDNLTAIVDYNKLQGFGRIEDIMPLEPFSDKWTSFGWSVREIDGHDHDDIEKTLRALPFEQGKPSAIIAHTVKGKGVSFMENKLEWHYRSPDDDQLARALSELGKLP